MFIHHAILVPQDDDVFAVRALAQKRGYEIGYIDEPKEHFGNTELFRFIDIVKPLPNAAEEDAERRAIAALFSTAYCGTLVDEKE
jgi:hypothetical protein